MAILVEILRAIICFFAGVGMIATLEWMIDKNKK